MGYSVVTTVLSGAVTSSLTDLATVKDELALDSADTSDDAWLTRAIRQVSAAISNHTKRAFAPELVIDAFDVQQDPYPYQTPGGFSQLELSRWPVLALLSVTQTVALNTTQSLTEGVDYRLDATTGRLQRLNPFTGVATTWEALPVAVEYIAGYGAAVQETHSVPASPYQVTVGQATAFSCDQQVSYADGTALTRVVGAPAQGQYTVTEGVYTLAPADVGQALTFAYATFAAPDDLVEIALRLITARYKAKDRDPALIQRETPGIGIQRWWVGGAPGQKGPFSPDIEAALDAYRMPVVA